MQSNIPRCKFLCTICRTEFDQKTHFLVQTIAKDKRCKFKSHSGKEGGGGGGGGGGGCRAGGYISDITKYFEKSILKMWALIGQKPCFYNCMDGIHGTITPLYAIA